MPAFLFIGGGADGKLLNIDKPAQLITVSIPQIASSLVSIQSTPLMGAAHDEDYDAMQVAADGKAFIVYKAKDLKPSDVFRLLFANYRPKK